jgi:hypothetical protein
MSEFFLDWHFSDDNPNVLYIMRGVPGSGKSFTANTLAPPENIFSADKFFGSTIEEYIREWKPEKLHAAHSMCQRHCKIAMQNRLYPIVVDNTNVQVRDIFPYLELALQYDYRVEIKEPTSPWWVEKVAPFLSDKVKYVAELDAAAKLLTEKNQHGVPEVTIRAMLNKWHTNVSAEDMMKSILRRK